MDWLSNKVIAIGLLLVFLVTLSLSQPQVFQGLFAFMGISLGEIDKIEDGDMVTPTLSIVTASESDLKVDVTSDTNLLSPSRARVTSDTSYQIVSNKSNTSAYTPSSDVTSTAVPRTDSVSSSPLVTISKSDLININTAGLTELEKITGIGPVYAQNIIDYRKANGPFQKIEDVINVKGIGDKTFQKMKDEITVGP